ncbi:MAG: ATP synthase F0 subunit C [Planctomycetia bacterium]|nr:ATP synthase F0 subunit C [Planctomycetia bacterium]
MNKFARIATFLCIFALVCAPLTVFAQEATAPAETTAAAESAAVAAPAVFNPMTLGVGLVLLAAGLGIGKIGATAVDSMARQPEAAGSIQTAMIISAALIEGVTFFALIVCFLTLVL